MKGKDKCEMLKAIRLRTAEANDIDYTPIVCNHEGECSGSCPACEAEAYWLMEQLEQRKLEEKPVVTVDVDEILMEKACEEEEEEIRRINSLNNLRGAVLRNPTELKELLKDAIEDEEAQIKHYKYINSWRYKLKRMIEARLCFQLTGEPED